MRNINNCFFAMRTRFSKFFAVTFKSFREIVFIYLFDDYITMTVTVYIV